jgi:NAD-dependent deacetylase
VPRPLDDAAGALRRARELIRGSRFVTVLTGAGVSAESGVPTFRGAGGLWRSHRAQELATPEAFARDPRLVWDWYLWRRGVVAACEPNAAHTALAMWAARHAGALVTQNVDGLHERAGHPSVIRLHGSLWRNRCSGCGTEREAHEMAYPELPRSPCCAELERPAIVWFGEGLPRRELAAALSACDEADALLVVGTSGVVQPAASLADRVRARGAPVIEVNPEPVRHPRDIVIASPAGTCLPELLAGP